MSLLPFQHQATTHWESGSLSQALRHAQVLAPHTLQPISEALLMGISGGVVVGYFTFQYEGYDPQVNILTRNTFDPFSRMLDRLKVVREVIQTTQAEKAKRNLHEALQSGFAPIAWADSFTLPYSAEPDWGEIAHAMFPLVVFAQEDERVRVSDRAQMPFDVPQAQFMQAWGKVKKNKYRLMTVLSAQPDQLPEAVRRGIDDCIKLYVERPPKGSPNNFGLQALQHWADRLVAVTGKGNWEKDYPVGRKLFTALESAFTFSVLFGKTDVADRATYATFLEEASDILQRPALCEVATLFRVAGHRWADFTDALLPNELPLFAEARRAWVLRHQLFREQGEASVVERFALAQTLRELRQRSVLEFPLNEAQARVFRADLSERLRAVIVAERHAVEALIEAMQSN